MLEYTEKILQNVSFDVRLFQKEIEKAMLVLNPREISLLGSWLKRNYSEKYPEVVSEYFG